MTAWLLRKTASSVSVDLKNSKFTVRSTTRPAFRPGDDVVLMGGYSKAMSFDYFARLVTVTHSTTEALSTTVVTVDEWRRLPEATTVDLLQFSLVAVKNLERPYLHFRRTYRRLPTADFETVKAGEPFIERSAYYLLLRALPVSLRESFEQELRWSGLQRARLPALEQRLSVLLDFIYTRVLSVGQLLKQIDTLIARHPSLSMLDRNVVSHEFCDPDSDAFAEWSAGDDIRRQAAHFRAFEDTLREQLSPEMDLDSSEGFHAAVQRSVLEGRATPAQRRFAEVFRNG